VVEKEYGSGSFFICDAIEKRSVGLMYDPEYENLKVILERCASRRITGEEAQRRLEKIWERAYGESFWRAFCRKLFTPWREVRE
jgi:hypothetical protein